MRDLGGGGRWRRPPPPAPAGSSGESPAHPGLPPVCGGRRAPSSGLAAPLGRNPPELASKRRRGGGGRPVGTRGRGAGFPGLVPGVPLAGGGCADAALVPSTRRDGRDLGPAGASGATGMEQLPYREAAAAEAGDRPGWCRDSLGDGGGPAGDSAACNGSCARPLEEDDHDRDRSFPSPASLRPDGSCSGSCRHRGPAATAGLPEEGEEEGGGGEGRGGRRPRRRQRLRSAPKERDEAGASRRHRPPPRRSPGSGQGSPRPAEGPVGSQWPLAAALARLRLLHSCCRLGTGDTGWVPAGARGWGQRLRGGSWRAARGLRATAGLTLRFLYMLFALLVLLLMLLLGALRLCWRQGAAVLAGSRTWMLLEGSRLGQHLRDWVQKEAASAPGGAPGAGEEVTRLVAMAEVPEEELNPFQVLGVEATATDAELRRAYRRLAVLVRAGAGVLGVSPHPRARS